MRIRWQIALRIRERNTQPPERADLPAEGAARGPRAFRGRGIATAARRDAPTCRRPVLAQNIPGWRYFLDMDGQSVGHAPVIYTGSPFEFNGGGACAEF